MEIRGGVGGEESALFAHSLYRMYTMYAQRRGWQVSLLNYNETELGGVKEADFEISGEGAYSRLKFESGVHRCSACRRPSPAGASIRRRQRSPSCPRWRRPRSTSGPRTSRCRFTARPARADSTSTRHPPPCGSFTSRPVSSWPVRGGALAGAEPREVHADAGLQAL